MAIHNVINTISKGKFQKILCIKWPDHMQLCIAADGHYFKKEPEITDDDQTDDDCKEDM